MLIKQGITAVTGGAYSGKTTLLEAIQSGEFIIILVETDESML